MTDRELMQQALHTLEGWANVDDWVWPETAKEQAKRNTVDAITALRERLAQAEQEPVAWSVTYCGSHCNNIFSNYEVADFERKKLDAEHGPADRTLVPLYTAPPPRQPLTDEELWKFWWSRPEVPDGEDDSMEAEFVAAVRRVLAAHGIGKGEA